MTRRTGATCLLLVLALGACGAPAATPTPPPTQNVPSGPTASLTPEQEQAIYADIERQVVEIRSLEPTTAVTPVILDEAGLRVELAKQVAADTSAQEVARQQRLLQSLGVLPPDADLAAIVAAFQGSQVAGFYVPADGNLYVVSRSGGLGPVERTTFAHEFTHALQDQHFPLLDQMDSQPATPANGDRDLARLSLVEGDATLSMSYWAQQHLSPIDLLSILGTAMDPAQTDALNAMPPFLRETTLSPYQDGLQFAMALQVPGGWPAVDGAYARPPDSTEQVLHAAKYVADETPVLVELPPDVATRLGAGWTTDVEDTLGELQLRAWLTARGVPTTTAGPAAAGWSGDLVARYQGPNDAWALAIATAWDAAGDVGEFSAAATTATSTGDPAAVSANGSRVIVAIASDPTTLAALQAALR